MLSGKKNQSPRYPPVTIRSESPPENTPGEARAAARVGTGIFISRLFGFVRDRVFAHYFGTSDFADAWRAGLRMPNVVQNLLGEGTLSASVCRRGLRDPYSCGRGLGPFGRSACPHACRDLFPALGS